MTVLLARRALAEYARRPLNLALLVLVPVVFVAMSAGTLAEFADLLGGAADLGTIEAATAGWAASVLAGVAGFFHVAGSREADRRLAAAGGGTLRIVAARLGSGIALAALAACGSLVALATRTDIATSGRVVAMTLVFALIYLGIGTSVGALVRSELNGSLIVVFAWMFDVFFGPAMGGSSSLIRAFPLHFPTLVVTDVASGHAGPLGDIGISIAWTLASLAMATAALFVSTRPMSHSRPAGRHSLSRTLIGLRYAFRDYRRNPALWVLLVGLPLMFITLSIAVTPNDPAVVELTEGGTRSLHELRMPDLHGAIMVPITVGFLSGLAGLFVALGSAEGDRRLALAGFRVRELLVARAGVMAAASLLATAVSLAVTAASFGFENWTVFVVANVLVALTYALIGALVGPVFGLLGGLYVMLVLPFIDIGIAQNAMFDAAPPGWATFLPSHGAVRVLLDGAFTPTMDETGALLMAMGWLVALGAATAMAFRRLAAPARG